MGLEQLTDSVLVELTVEITMLTLEPSKAFLGAVYPLGKRGLPLGSSLRFLTEYETGSGNTLARSGSYDAPGSLR